MGKLDEAVGAALDWRLGRCCTDDCVLAPLLVLMLFVLIPVFCLGKLAPLRVIMVAVDSLLR